MQQTGRKKGTLDFRSNFKTIAIRYNSRDASNASECAFTLTPYAELTLSANNRDGHPMLPLWN